jgi:hypothetical protein
MRPLKVPNTSDHDIEAMLRRIGRRVLDDVWISGQVRVFAYAVVAVLAGASVFGWCPESEIHCYLHDFTEAVVIAQKSE